MKGFFKAIWEDIVVFVFLPILNFIHREESMTDEELKTYVAEHVMPSIAAMEGVLAAAVLESNAFWSELDKKSKEDLHQWHLKVGAYIDMLIVFNHKLTTNTMESLSNCTTEEQRDLFYLPCMHDVHKLICEFMVKETDKYHKAINSEKFRYLEIKTVEVDEKIQ